ncbi:aldose epimerase family protein [Sunxiuqinia sp. A32]|uniref:aldose epimerase family protein n=1 Tax=Sunxiuqinia sp. A32 TaxID=3461496 RepID=UPI004045EA2C
MKISKRDIGIVDQRNVSLFRLTNNHGSYIELINYGATLVSAVVPDKFGELENVVLGFPSLDGYLNDCCYIGSTIGRYANRIGNASLKIDKKKYQLDRNDNINTNHGGFSGFHSKIFDWRIEKDSIIFYCKSPDGEGGLPGNLQFSVTYSWNDNQELSIKYWAETDKPTIAYFTNHAYFNLSALKESALEQSLAIRSSNILENTEDFIPTGKIIPTGKLKFWNNRIMDKISWQANGFKGINSYYIFDENQRDKVQCCLVSGLSSRKLDVFTSYPGIQLYTGDYLDTREIGMHGLSYKPFDGICLECQHYPDSTNHSHFPSIILRPEDRYEEFITYKFSLDTN